MESTLPFLRGQSKRHHAARYKRHRAASLSRTRRVKSNAEVQEFEPSDGSSDTCTVALQFLARRRRYLAPYG